MFELKYVSRVFLAGEHVYLKEIISVRFPVSRSGLFHVVILLSFPHTMAHGNVRLITSYMREDRSDMRFVRIKIKSWIL